MKHRRHTHGFSMALKRGFLRIGARIPSLARRDRMHFLQQSVALAGCRQMGEFKNSAGCLTVLRNRKRITCTVACKTDCQSVLRLSFNLSFTAPYPACPPHSYGRQRRSRDRARDQTCPTGGRPRITIDYRSPISAAGPKLPATMGRTDKTGAALRVAAGTSD